MASKSKRRIALEAEAAALEAEIRELEPKKAFELVLAFDPTPIPARTRLERGGPVADEDAWSVAELPSGGEVLLPRSQGSMVPVTKRRGPDGRAQWLLRCEVTA